MNLNTISLSTKVKGTTNNDGNQAKKKRRKMLPQNLIILMSLARFLSYENIDAPDCC